MSPLFLRDLIVLIFSARMSRADVAAWDVASSGLTPLPALRAYSIALDEAEAELTDLYDLA